MASGSKPKVFVFSVCGLHLQVARLFKNILRCCMLPNAAFVTHVALVEDGVDRPVLMSHANALDMFDEMAPVAKTRRLRTRSLHPNGSSLLVATEVGRLTASGVMGENDRIVIFSDDQALHAELHCGNIFVVSPAAICAHDQWWVDRERELLTRTAPVIVAADSRAPSTVAEEKTPSADEPVVHEEQAPPADEPGAHEEQVPHVVASEPAVVPDTDVADSVVDELIDVAVCGEV